MSGVCFFYTKAQKVVNIFHTYIILGHNLWAISCKIIHGNTLQAMSNQASLGPTQAWGCWPYWGQIGGLKPSAWLQPYWLVATTLPYMDVSMVV
jgi:hypothetical protein